MLDKTVDFEGDKKLNEIPMKLKYHYKNNIFQFFAAYNFFLFSQNTLLQEPKIVIFQFL